MVKEEMTRINKLRQRLALIGTMPAEPTIDQYGRVISNEPQTFQQQSTRARVNKNMRVWARADDFKLGPSGKKELNWDKMIEDEAKPGIEQYSNIPEEEVEGKYTKQIKRKRKLSDASGKRFKPVNLTHDRKTQRKLQNRPPPTTVVGGRRSDPYGSRDNFLFGPKEIIEKQPPSENLFRTEAPQDIKKSRFPYSRQNKYSKLKQRLARIYES